MRLRGIGLTAVVIAAVACGPTPAGPSADPGSTAGPGRTDAAMSTAPESVGPTPSPSFVRPTPNPSPTFLVYEVQPGDTLTSIARQFGTTARSIAYWNRASYPSLDPDSPAYEPNRIVAGWTLQLIPTAIVDEDDLPDPTPSPTPEPSSSPAGSGASPS